MLQQWLAVRLRAMHTYRPPTDDERARAVAALKSALAGRTPPSGVDRRPYTLLAEPPGTGWGTVVLQGRPELVVEVPHPGSDRFTARLGLELFRAIPDAALLIAGAHRRLADVAHRADSLFHTYAQTLGTAELQLHGFAATTAPGTDAVLSPGAGRTTTHHRLLEKALSRHGFRVADHERLAGRTNVQGIAAAARGTPFLHLELAPILRGGHRHRVVDAVTETWHQHRH